MFLFAEYSSKSKWNPSSDIFNVFLYFFRSDLFRNQLFRLRITVNTICFSSPVKKQLGGSVMIYNLRSLFSLGSRPQFLGVYRRDNPRGMLGEHEKSL